MFRLHSRNIQLVSWAVVLTLSGWFTIVVFLSSYPLTFQAYTFGLPHFNGTILGGIRWDENQTDLRVWITNPTTDNYEAVDIIVDTDSYIEQVGQLQTIPSCTVALAADGEGHIVIRDSSGVQHVISVPIGSSLGTGYRILCDKLPARSSIQLVLATSTANHERSYPTRVTIKGGYRVAFRNRDIDTSIRVTPQ